MRLGAARRRCRTGSVLGWLRHAALRAHESRRSGRYLAGPIRPTTASRDNAGSFGAYCGHSHRPAGKPQRRGTNPGDYRLAGPPACATSRRRRPTQIPRGRQYQTESTVCHRIRCPGCRWVVSHFGDVDGFLPCPVWLPTRGHAYGKTASTAHSWIGCDGDGGHGRGCSAGHSATGGACRRTAGRAADHGGGGCAGGRCRRSGSDGVASSASACPG